MLITRTDLQSYLFDQTARSRCVSLVGVSNIGKSTLLRDFRQTQVRAALRPDLSDDFHIFHIDCNRMLEESEQAFYELILRVLLQSLQNNDPTLRASIQRAYDQLIAPPSKLHIPLSFNQAITTLVESQAEQVVLVFDEFDSAFRALDGRVFLNLRALKDRYGNGLSYVTASHRRLIHLRMGEDVDDFIELFRTNIRFVPPLSARDTRILISTCVADMDARFDDADMAFILEQAGGHPALTELACRKLAQITGKTARTPNQDALIHHEIRDQLRRDPGVRAECKKIWRDLTDMEQATIESFHWPERKSSAEALDELMRKGLLLPDDDAPRCFATLFSDFIQYQTLGQRIPQKGIYVDAESGQVTIDGHPAQNLTRLESRMLMLLYENLNKVCDKYSIVEAVWGEDYVDSIYDSAIEKMVSRLRKKVEPNPAQPRYILTIRGRGYKLVG
jgi:DNA-binding winged helix-turn-helix (wHTH) protein